MRKRNLTAEMEAKISNTSELHGADKGKVRRLSTSPSFRTLTTVRNAILRAGTAAGKVEPGRKDPSTNRTYPLARRIFWRLGDCESRLSVVRKNGIKSHEITAAYNVLTR